MSTINCNPVDNAVNDDYLNDNKWQTLSSGFRYGSFFVLYGKLRGEINGDRFMPKECDLYLQTFDGTLTIGLANSKSDPITMEMGFHPLFRKFMYVLRVHIEPLNTNNHLHRQEIHLETQEANFDHLNDTLRSQVADYKTKGLPANNPMLIDMSFTDLTTIKIDSTGKSQKIIPDSPSSPMIDSNLYVREGSQILKMHTEPVSDNILNNFNKDDFNAASRQDWETTVEALTTVEANFWNPGGIPINNGYILGFGCHPNTVRISF